MVMDGHVDGGGLAEASPTQPLALRSCRPFLDIQLHAGRSPSVLVHRLQSALFALSLLRIFGSNFALFFTVLRIG
jgi:hypothetical protein